MVRVEKKADSDIVDRDRYLYDEVVYDIELHLVVEAKSENKRDSDRIAVRAQEVLFDFLKDEKILWRLETDATKLERELKMIAGS